MVWLLVSPDRNDHDKETLIEIAHGQQKDDHLGPVRQDIYMN